MRRLSWIWFLAAAAPAWALDLCLPTPNDALFRPGGAAAFYQPTVEGTVESGMFGCTRRDGRRFHEGVDIRCVERDRRGECVDPVWAVGEGVVAFINHRPGLSNYGRYVMLEHHWDGVRVHTLYAHLREVADGLTVGQTVAKGHRLGTVGRSTNTREGISPDRAHLHFEIGFLLNPHFQRWNARREPNAPPFGNYNGQNFSGLDPAAFFHAYAADRTLNFAGYLARQPIAFTVLVRADRLPWAQLHPEQITGNGPAPYYEVGVTTTGLPVKLWRRATVDRPVPALHLVNEPLLATVTCRQLVSRVGDAWQFTPTGRDWLDLLTYRPD